MFGVCADLIKMSEFRAPSKIVHMIEYWARFCPSFVGLRRFQIELTLLCTPLPLQPGPTSPSSRTSASRSRPDVRWHSWAPAGLANRRSSSCWSVSTTRQGGRSFWTVTTFGRSSSSGCGSSTGELLVPLVWFIPCREDRFRSG